MSVRIFLSYARGDDEPFVRRLYEGLKAVDFNAWFDRVSMPPANSRSIRICDAVAACDGLPQAWVVLQW
jgi:TIR domain